MIKNTEYTNPTMARIIIKNTNCVYHFRRMQKNFIDKLVKCLEELKNTECSNLTLAQVSSYKVENFKNLLLQVGGKRVNFTEEEEGSLGLDLYNAMRPVQRNVEFLPSLAAKEEKFYSKLLSSLEAKEERLPSLATKEELLPPLPTKAELVECLQNLIEYVEYTDITVVRGKSSLDLIPEVGIKQKNFTEKFVKCIEELKHTDYSKAGVAYASNATVDSFLSLLFEVGRQRINFTEGEKKQIGNLLVDVIKPIQMNISYIRIRSRSSQYFSVLMKRSVLQFLIEDYGQFPARSSTLKNELEKVNIKGSIAYLDHIIEKWRDASDPDMEDSDYEADAPLGMPDTHTWWSK